MVHENLVFASARLAAAGLLQRYARVWLRRRKKLRRKERSRAAKSLQRSVRAWLLPRVVASATSSVATAAAPGYNEDDVLCVVCIERPRVMLFLGCAHLCACEDCASMLVACPLCRAVRMCMVGKAAALAGGLKRNPLHTERENDGNRAAPRESGWVRQA